MFQYVGVFKCQSLVKQPPLAITELLVRVNKKASEEKVTEQSFHVCGILFYLVPS